MVSAASDKKANKKLKDETGSAVPVSTDDAVGDKKSRKQKKKDKKAKEVKTDEATPTSSPDKEKAAKNLGPLKEMSGGLKYRDVKTGTGKQAKTGNTVSMR
jgi:FK506-binding nuclear protein